MRQMTEDEFVRFWGNGPGRKYALSVAIEHGWIKEEKKKVKRYQWAYRVIPEKSGIGSNRWQSGSGFYTDEESEILKHDYHDVRCPVIYEICKIPGSEIEVEE